MKAVEGACGVTATFDDIYGRCYVYVDTCEYVCVCVCVCVGGRTGEWVQMSCQVP
jgi:hypothetical protein